MTSFFREWVGCICKWFSSDLVLLCGLRFESVDLTTRLLIPIIVLQNHNRYNIMEKGHNYSLNIEAIEAEVSFPICIME